MRLEWKLESEETCMIPMTKSMVTCGFGGVVKRACEYLLLLTRRLEVPYLHLHVECDRLNEHAFD